MSNNFTDLSGLPLITSTPGFEPEEELHVEVLDVDTGAGEEQVVVLHRVGKLDSNGQGRPEWKHRRWDSFAYRVRDIGRIVPYEIRPTREDILAASRLGLENVYDLYSVEPVPLTLNGRTFTMRWPHIEYINGFNLSVLRGNTTLTSVRKAEPGEIVLPE